MKNSGESIARIYHELNQAHRKTLIYRFGDEAGFFSEFNNMILAMLYCLDRRIRFVLYTPPDGSLSIRKGWNDYFQPFCEQTTLTVFKDLDVRYLMQKLPFSERLRRAVIKRKTGFHYYTYELWEKFRSDEFVNERFNIPNLGINGDLLHATSRLIGMVWNYSTDIKGPISSMITESGLPMEYVGLHVRGGDKSIEAKVFEPDEYMELIKKHTKQKNIFVLTDEFRHLKYLRDKYTDFSFYSMCGENEMGYDFKSFQKLDKAAQLREYIKLLASMEVLKNASLSFGSYKTNPGMFLGMCIGERFVGIDSDRWLVKW